MEGPHGTFTEFFFWLSRVFDAQCLIPERFVRYPYNNISLRKDATEHEQAKKYLKETEGFHVPRLTEEGLGFCENKSELVFGHLCHIVVHSLGCVSPW